MLVRCKQNACKIYVNRGALIMFDLTQYLEFGIIPRPCSNCPAVFFQWTKTKIHILRRRFNNLRLLKCLLKQFQTKTKTKIEVPQK